MSVQCVFLAYFFGKQIWRLLSIYIEKFFPNLTLLLHLVVCRINQHVVPYKLRGLNRTALLNLTKSQCRNVVTSSRIIASPVNVVKA